jgi:hypothetical protein
VLKDEEGDNSFYIDTLDGTNNLLVDLKKLEGKHLKNFSIDNLTTQNIINTNVYQDNEIQIIENKEVKFDLDFKND